MRRIAELCRTIAENRSFESLIIALILVNATLMGIETVPELRDQYELPLIVIFLASQLIFVIEIAIRLLAYLPKPRRFFSDPWNTFDFTVVALSLIPAVGSVAFVARLARIFRIARLVSVSQELRDFVGSFNHSLSLLLRSFPLTIAFLYIFTLLGYDLLGIAAPGAWGTLPEAAKSVLLLATFQGGERALAESKGTGVLFVLVFYALWFALVINLAGAVIARHVHTTSSAEAEPKLD